MTTFPAASAVTSAPRQVTRKACAADVPAIREIVEPVIAQRRMIPINPVSFYTSLQRFQVAERDGHVVGCGALHVMWEDLAEIRTIAVRPGETRIGIGTSLLEALLREARALGMRRVFCLTFETAFFGRHGFRPVPARSVSPEIYAELLRYYDHDVAGKLDLSWIKPNTLGNTAMLLTLHNEPDTRASHPPIDLSP